MHTTNVSTLQTGYELINHVNMKCLKELKCTDICKCKKCIRRYVNNFNQFKQPV